MGDMAGKELEKGEERVRCLVSEGYRCSEGNGRAIGKGREMVVIDFQKSGERGKAWF